MMVLGAAIALTFTAGAVTKTYMQYGFTEVPNIAMDGIPSSTEIGETPQLAFPGVTLDDIHGHQFITELYGGGVDARATAWGIFPHWHRTNGSIDKMSLQFGVKDGDYSKFVIFILTNGEGGVYVQKYGWCYKSGMCLRYRFNNLDGSGNFSFNGGDGNPDGSGTTGGYQAWGIRVHGVMPPANEERLAFPGAKLVNLTNYMFIAQLHIGGGIDNPNYDEIAECVTPWPSSDNVQKIVLQFRNPQQSNRAAVLELTEGADGVYVRHKWSKNNASASFTLDSSGNIDSSYFTTSGDWGSYCVWGLYGIPNYTYMQTTPRLVWTKKGGVLTLNELAGAKFTALFGGAWVNAGGLKNLTGETLVSGYNTRETIDANGDITEIVTEFEYNESGKTVVVKFTNGADGVYAQAIAARYNQTFGYVYSDAGGNFYGNGGISVATSRTAGGYGVCGLKAIADTAKIYRQGATHTFGVIDMASPTSSTKFPTSEVLGFSGLTLEDLSSCVFLSYMQSGSISGRYLLGKHPTLYPSSGDAEKLAVQFTAEDGSWKKSAYVQFAYNANGAVTMQKVRNTWTTSGNANTKYFNDKFFTVGPSDNASYDNINGGQNNNQYDLWGLQVFPGFVQTSPMLLFRGATLNDIENATFTARVGGPSISTLADRVNGYNKRVIKDGDDVTRILVEFQSQTDWIKTTIVEFTNGDGGVYGEAKEARYVGLGSGLGYQFVTAYDGTSITYAGNDASPATSPTIGGYGVYDVQAAVEPDANEWTLDADRNWSYYTGGETFDDDAATIRVRVTANGATLTVDENTSVGKIVFVNAAGVDVTTNSLVVASGITASFGDIEAGAGVHLTVPTSLGAVAATAGSNATIAYVGSGTVSGVLSGEGAVEVCSGHVTFTGANAFTGGLVVKSDTVAVAGLAVGQGASAGPFGEIDGNVVVEAGGMVDINGKGGLYYRYTLAGTGVATGSVAAPGPIVNLGGALDIGRLNWGEWTTGHARTFTLAGDIALGATGYDFGVVSKSTHQEASDECLLDLGNHTLTKTGSGTLYLWAKRFTTSGAGTLSIQDGVVNIRKGKYTGTSSSIAIGANGTLLTDTQVDVGSIVNDGRIEIAAAPWSYAGNLSYPYTGSTLKGTYSGSGELAVLANGRLVVDDPLTVADFVNNGKPVSGTAMLTVTGTLTPGNAIPKLTLADGATVKLTGMNNAQSVTGTFAAAGTVNVDGSAISDADLKAAGMVPVLSAPSLPAGIKQRFSAVGASNRTFRVVAEAGVSTVYMSRTNGFTVFVK